MQRVVFQRNEAMPFIKAFRVGIDGFNFNSMNSQLSRELKAAIQSILQEQFAQSLFLHRLIHGQARQENGRHRMFWKLLCKFLRDMLKEDRTGSQGVVTINSLFIGSNAYIGSPQLSFFILTYQGADKMIKGRLAAGKLPSLMALLQSFDGPVIHADVFWLSA